MGRRVEHLDLVAGEERPVVPRVLLEEAEDHLERAADVVEDRRRGHGYSPAARLDSNTRLAYVGSPSRANREEHCSRLSRPSRTQDLT